MRCPSLENFPLVVVYKSQVNKGVIFILDEVDLFCPSLRSAHNHNCLEMAPFCLILPRSNFWVGGGVADIWVDTPVKEPN